MFWGLAALTSEQNHCLQSARCADLRQCPCPRLVEGEGPRTAAVPVLSPRAQQLLPASSLQPGWAARYQVLLGHKAWPGEAGAMAPALGAGLSPSWVRTARSGCTSATPSRPPNRLLLSLTSPAQGASQLCSESRSLQQ